MDRCPACGAPTEPQDRFCGRCGGSLAGVAPVDPELARFCRGCGRPLQADARFCRRCGARAPEPVDDVFAGMPIPPEPEPQPKPRLAAEPPAMDELFVAALAAPAEAPTESIPLPRPAARTAAPRPAGPPRTSTKPRTKQAGAIRPTPEERPTAPFPRPERVAMPTRPTAAGARPHTGQQTVPDAPDEVEAELVPAGTGFPWSGTIPLLGALAVIVSAILEWGGPYLSPLPRDIGAARLWDPSSTAGPSLGIVLLITGTLGALVALAGMAAPGVTFVRRLVGVATLMIPLAFVLRTVEALAADGEIGSLPSALRVGVLVASLGGLLQMLAPRPWRPRPA